jgi:hypothetical protein
LPYIYSLPFHYDAYRPSWPKTLWEREMGLTRVLVVEDKYENRRTAGHFLMNYDRDFGCLFAEVQAPAKTFSWRRPA